MKTIPEKRVETDILAKRLLELRPDEVISYAELNAMCGLDVQNGSRHVLTSARRIAEREGGFVTECIHSVGIKRLLPNAVSSVLVTGRHRVTKSRARDLKRSLQIPKAEYESLLPEERMKLDLERTIATTQSQIGKEKAVKRLAPTIAAAGGELPVGRAILAMFAETK